ncbi:MAG: amidohydrolase [Nitrososphaeria archaeon]|nr:amidohydrolase [Nitrososphaeria archaeon]
MCAKSSVFDEIYSFIENLYVVDVHNHLNPSSLSPKSYEDVIFYHYIVTELASSGMSTKSLEGLKGFERIKSALPYIKFLRNTSTYWTLIKILHDLYGFDSPTIDESSFIKAIDLLEQKRGDEVWAKNILKNYVHVKKSILTFNPTERIPEYDKELFIGSLRMDPIIPNISKEVIQYLEQAYSIEIRSPNDLLESISKLVKTFSSHIVSFTINVQPDDNFIKLSPSEKEIMPYLQTLKNVGVIDATGRQYLASYLLNHLIELCKEYNLTVQLMLGVKRPVPGASPPDYAITVFNPQQLLDLTTLFSRNPEINFDVFISDSLLNHPLTVISKNYPNVFLSGYWWYTMYPEIIRYFLKLRIQMLPYNKIGGFFSDAYVADWVYGKAILAKRQIAHVLTEMVAEKYINKDVAFDIASALLHENAYRIYRKL